MIYHVYAGSYMGEKGGDEVGEAIGTCRSVKSGKGKRLRRPER